MRTDNSPFEDSPPFTHRHLHPVDFGLLYRIGYGKNEPQYEPPYDSPLEESFAYNLVKYLNEKAKFRKQVPVDTLCGRFRMDFVIERLGRSIGLECDGKEYHNPLRDEWRDAMILATGRVASIYRFRGKDLFTNIDDCLLVLSSWEPQLFSDRGIINLNVLASEEAKATMRHRQLDKAEDIPVYYDNHTIYVKQHSYSPVNYGTEYLMKKVAFAKEHGGGDLDLLIKKYDSERTPELESISF